MAEFAYNNHIHTTTKRSPFQASRGYHPHSVLTQIRASSGTTPRADEIADELKTIHNETKAAIAIAQERMKLYFDRKVSDMPDLPIGSKVWLDSKNITTTAPSTKLADRKLGPFKILRKISTLNYELELPKTIKIHPVFHVSLLEPYKETTIPNRHQEPPPPTEVEGEDEYEIEKILDARLWRNQKQYLVKWQGYTDADNTWEPISHLENSPDAITDFHAKHPEYKWDKAKRRKKQT
jgi:hypothetical protein